jgi:hypothetical protein
MAKLHGAPKGRSSDTVPEALDEWSEAVDVLKADDLTRQGVVDTVNRIERAREDYNVARRRELGLRED